MTNIALETHQTAQDARNDARATEGTAPTLTQHARALADELRGGPVAASLLAMANECERLRAERDGAREMAAFHRAEMGEAMLIIEQQDRNLARLDAIGRRVVEAWREAQAAATLANEAWGRERQRRRIAEAAWQAREGERE